MNIRYKLIFSLLSFVMLLWACKRDDEFSKDYDINWPQPTIESVTPGDVAEIGSVITINGTGLDKVLSVSIDGRTMSVIDTSATQITVRLPRRFSSSKITLTNLYRQTVTSESVIAPAYPDVVVTEFPGRIEQDQTFSIKGVNVDLITSVKIGEHSINVNGNNPASLTVPTSGLGLKVGDMVVVEVSSNFSGVTNAKSSPIEVVAKSAFYIPAAPVVLWDFENNINPFKGGDITPANGINLNANIKAGRGEKYLGIKENNVSDPWGVNIGSITKTDVASTAEFKGEPHLTFLLNTGAGQGYFQIELKQNGVKSGAHFTGGITGNPKDDYVFDKTNGAWVWKSVPLSQLKWEDWGAGALQFDKNAPIEEITFTFKQGNGANPYEIYLDQVMITDGPQRPIATLWNFENGVSPVTGSSATHGINLAGIPGIAGNYLTVRKSNVSSWEWLGGMNNNAGVDLALARDPHLNFWINTNGKQGYFQIEVVQNNVKWGAHFIPDYLFETNGWELRSIRLTELAFEKWGGDGSANTFDAKAAITEFNIGFSGGNISGNYEINLDNVMISDGPMF